MARIDTVHDDRIDEGTMGLRRLLPLKRRRRPRVSLYEARPDELGVTVVTALILLLILCLAAVL